MMNIPCYVIFRNPQENKQKIKEFNENFRLRSLISSNRWRLFKNDTKKKSQRITDEELTEFLRSIKSADKILQIFSDQSLVWPFVLKQLSPISFASIELLDLKENLIVSVEPIGQMNCPILKMLDFCFNMINNFNPLTRMNSKRMKSLMIYGNQCCDQRFTKRLPFIDQIYMDINRPPLFDGVKCHVESISFIAGMKPSKFPFQVKVSKLQRIIDMERLDLLDKEGKCRYWVHIRQDLTMSRFGNNVKVNESQMFYLNEFRSFDWFLKNRLFANDSNTPARRQEIERRRGGEIQISLKRKRVPKYSPEREKLKMRLMSKSEWLKIVEKEEIEEKKQEKNNQKKKEAEYEI